uniref:Putative retroelement pol polyprotein-like, related n=1 Tax=Solanum demissum TaxID=50514 RepID=Q6L3I9_SOLDE|nr:Putative retroelement pol polyprotein-like, related [Solanum demissum]
MSLTSFNQNSQQLVNSISHDIESCSYEEAVIDPAWQAALTSEFEALYSNNTWELVKLPAGKKIIGCKWVYKIKHKADGTVQRYNAIFVVKGYTQQAGIDYTDYDCTITAYCDSDWATFPDSKRSVSGYIVLMGDSPICLSSAEAEYRAVRKVVGELVWLERLLTELHSPCNLLVSVFCDSQAAIHIAKNPVFHEMEGLIMLHHIPTDEQLADVLTKPLPSSKHSILLHKLAMSYSPPT